MQRSLNAGVYRYELIASRDGTHVIVIAANGHNQQVEDAIFATAERLIATRDSTGPVPAFTSTYVPLTVQPSLACL